MAEVFLARLEAAAGAGRQVVLKRVLPQLSEQPDFLALFVGEARLSMQLSHGNVVQVFDFGEVAGQYFLAMEYVDGLTLGSLLDLALDRKLPGLPAPVAAIIGIELCKALHYAHRKADEHGTPLRVVHRDISPENVLISWEGQVKLSDFGIARAVMEGRERTRPDVFRGRLDFCAPEQARAEPVDARSDLYSVGLVLTTLVLGTNPVEPIALQVASGEVATPLFPTDAVDEGFAVLIDRCTAPNPDDRFADAQALHEALQRWLVANTTSNTVTALPDLLAWLRPDEASKRGLPPAREGFEYWLRSWTGRESTEVVTDKVSPVTHKVQKVAAPARAGTDTLLWLAVGLVVLGVVGVVAGVANRRAAVPEPDLVLPAPNAQVKVRSVQLDGRTHSVFVDPAVGEGFAMNSVQSSAHEEVAMLCTFFDDDLKTLSTSVIERGLPFRAADAKWARRWLPDAPQVSAGVRKSLVLAVPAEHRATFERLEAATTYEVVVDGDATVLLALGRTSLVDRPTRFLDQASTGWVSVVAGRGTRHFTGAQSLWVTILSPAALGTKAQTQVALSVAPRAAVVEPPPPVAVAPPVAVEPAPARQPASQAPSPSSLPPRPLEAPPAPKRRLPPAAAMTPATRVPAELARSGAPPHGRSEQDQLAAVRKLIANNQLEVAVVSLESCVKTSTGSLRATCYKLLGSTHAKLATQTGSSSEIDAAQAAYRRYLKLASPDDPDVPVVRKILEASE